MAEAFDPYHVWLGIPPAEQPADYYRLLAIPPFEASPDVIDSAADRQAAHLRTFQGGKHGPITQRLLNEVAAARVCLLNTAQKAAYDQRLRARATAAMRAAHGESSGPTATAPASANPGPLNRPPPRRSSVAGGATASGMKSAAVAPAAGATTDAAWDELLGSAPGSLPSTPSKSSARGHAKLSSNRRRNSVMLACAVAMVAVGAIVVASRHVSPTALAFEWTAANRGDAALTVDGIAVPIPAQGTWEFPCSPGQRHIVVERPAFKSFDKMVAVDAGERQSVVIELAPKATLVLSWPASERRGAELKIDGRLRVPGDSASIELAVEPGQHVVRVARGGARTFETSVSVAADGRRVVAIPSAEAAVLIVDWPVAERRGGQLNIDGQGRPPSDSERLELFLRPGDHTVSLVRPGFRPFERHVHLDRAGEMQLAPVWTPVDAVVASSSNPVAESPSDHSSASLVTSNGGPVGHTAATPITTVPNTAAPNTTVPERKLAVPAIAEQAKIGKDLEALFKSEPGLTKTQFDANALYAMANKPGTLPAERYVLLTKGAELAERGGDLGLAFEGIDTATADFEFDPFDAKQKLLAKFVLIATSADQLDSLTLAAEPLIDGAIAADQYEAAMAIAATATKALAKRPGDLQLRKQTEDRLNHRRQQIRALEPIFAAARKAQAALNADPTNAEANLTVGRWDCLVKANWTDGLPQLARSSDERLKSLATQELKPPANAAEQLHLADSWWELAKAETPLTREQIRQHAGTWYRTALPHVDSALKRVPIESRIREIGKPQQTNRIPLGQWVDLLPLVDLAKHVEGGNWTRTGADVSVQPQEGSRIRFPVAIRGSYDMQVEFTRTIGNCDISTVVPVGLHRGSVNLSGFGGGASGLDGLDGRRVDNHDNPIAVRPGGLENFHRYRTLIRVRYLSDSRATIDVSLDGKPYFPHWEGNPASLDRGPAAASADPRHAMPEFGVWDSGATLHSLRIRMLSGEAIVATD
jgi:hypothetical protein